MENKLICGDVIESIRGLPNSDKFDLVIADPPYNIGKDFGNTKDNMSIEDYLIWSKNWIDECFNVLKDDGIIYVYGFSEILARISSLYPIENQRWLVWHYTNKTTPSSRFWQRSHESILCLWKKECSRPVLEIDQIREPYTEGFISNAGKVRKNTQSRFGNNPNTIYKAHEKGALPRDVLKIPALAGGAGRSERWFLCKNCDHEVYHPSELKNHRNHNVFKHPTQKPFQLTEKLIKSCINLQDKGNVLIPFAGSGSECAVSQLLEVNWVGIEINPFYVEFINKWLGKI